MAEIKDFEKFSNRLIKEKSPYLLQHAHNPVDWYPWGEEAFEKARQENKAIFLSVGYSTCHWCHVMAHESFEDEAVAKIMNENFVNIKIDREERPDIDKIYMTFVVSINGSGGWPMNVFIDPYSLGPFTGGTYFPPTPKYGSLSFTQILKKVASLWSEESQSLMESSESIVKALKDYKTESDGSYEPNTSILIDYFKNASQMYDREEGGFNKSPKFPTPVMFTGLLNYYKISKNEEALEMCKKSLYKMAKGGIYDQLGGGFHRYSVTRDWLVPHFEKMLYDQSQLIITYLELYQLTKDEFFANIARDTMNYILTQMKDDMNGIYSAEDADSSLPEDPSKHGEGAFYIWRKSEIENILDQIDTDIFCMHYGIEDQGNVDPKDDPHDEFNGKNILHVTSDIDEIAKYLKIEYSVVENSLKKSKSLLFNVRAKRPRPHLDDKILTEWNALIISAFAKAYQVLGDDLYIKTASNIISFLKNELYDSCSNTLFRSYRNGPSDIKAFSNDYSSLICALIDTYESGFDINHLKWAKELQDQMIELFYDNEDGGFFQTRTDKNVISRMKDNNDNTEPSSNSFAVMNLLRLHQFTNNEKYYDYALNTIKCFSSQLQKVPAIAPYMASSTRLFTNKMQIIIAGDKDSEETKKLIKTVHSTYEPSKVLIFDDSGEGRKAFEEWGHPMFSTDDLKLSGKSCAYVCKNFTCNMPVTTTEDLLKLIQ